jgi:hypothetical protein
MAKSVTKTTYYRRPVRSIFRTVALYDIAHRTTRPGIKKTGSLIGRASKAVWDKSIYGKLHRAAALKGLKVKHAAIQRQRSAFHAASATAATKLHLPKPSRAYQRYLHAAKRVQGVQKKTRGILTKKQRYTISSAKTSPEGKILRTGLARHLRSKSHSS